MQKSHDFATLLRTKHKLDIAFPVKAHGLIQVQSPQWLDFVLSIQGQAMELGVFEPVVCRQTAGVVLEKQNRERRPDRGSVK